MDIIDLMACFPPDCTLYPDTNCWPPDMPERLRDTCEVGLNCFIDVAYGADLAPLEDGSWNEIQCVCESGGTASLGAPVGTALEAACCDDPSALHLEQYWDILPALDACGSVLYNIYHECTPGGQARWEVCAPGDWFPVALNAEFVLDVDESVSYLTVATAMSTETVPVVGGGSARSGPDKFLTATLAAGDGEFVSQSFTEWLWWMEGPMDIDVAAGTISVPMDVDQPFYGRGKVNTVPYWAQVHMGDDAWGTLDDTTHTWTLDFVQDSVGWDVQIHLEGTYEDAD